MLSLHTSTLHSEIKIENLLRLFNLHMSSFRFLSTAITIKIAAV